MIGLILTSTLIFALTGLSLYYLFDTKLTLYTVGFFVAVIGAIGYIFKVLQLPGAGVMAGLNIFTYFIMSIIFIKSAIDLKHKTRTKIFFYYLLSLFILFTIFIAFTPYDLLKRSVVIILLFILGYMKVRQIYFSKEDSRLINILLLITSIHLTNQIN